MWARLAAKARMAPFVRQAEQILLSDICHRGYYIHAFTEDTEALQIALGSLAVVQGRYVMLEIQWLPDAAVLEGRALTEVPLGVTEQACLDFVAQNIELFIGDKFSDIRPPCALVGVMVWQKK